MQRNIGNVMVLKGRTIVTQAPAAPLSVLYLNPNSVSTNTLGYHSARLATEADLWQEFRFTKVRVVIHGSFVGNALNSANNSPFVMGFSNLVPNANPSTTAQIMEMPVSKFIFDPPNGVVTPLNSFHRLEFSIPREDLIHSMTPWLKCVTSTGGNDLTFQGGLYSLFNYVASTSTTVEYEIDWVCEFRNPVPAIETLVLRRDAPTYRDALLHELQNIEMEEKEETTSAASAVLVPGNRSGRPALVAAPVASSTYFRK